MLTLAVLGGSSYGSYALLEALHHAIEHGELPPLRVRLIARDTRRADAIINLHAARNSRDRLSSHLSLSSHPWGPSGLDNANFVLCQIRPGGMTGREQDEQLALAAGIPGDEGLGPSGFANFLRSYPVLVQTADLIRSTCPDAIVLQMSSPLGLTVRLFNDHGLRCYGVCELPMTTARTIYHEAKARHGLSIKHNHHFGVNHQCWLFNFTDDTGQDVTAFLLDQLDTHGVNGVDKSTVLKYQAFPVHYLRLHFHPEQLVQAQRQAGSRAKQLVDWQQRVDQCLDITGGMPDTLKAHSILGERVMNWYQDGVVPVLSAFTQTEPRRVSLNVTMPTDGYPIARSSVIEIPCIVSRTGIEPLLATSPVQVMHFTNRLLDYEVLAYQAAQHPIFKTITHALQANPMVSTAEIADRLAKKLVEDYSWN